MKKVLALILSSLLCSSVFARQYIMDITSTGNLIHNVSVIRALQADLTDVLIDLVKKGYKIVQVIPTTASGSIIGYVVIYEDDKQIVMRTSTIVYKAKHDLISLNGECDRAADLLQVIQKKVVRCIYIECGYFKESMVEIEKEDIYED